MSRFVVFLLAFQALGAVPAERDFSGVWKLNPDRSQLSLLPWTPDTTMRIVQDDGQLRVDSENGARTYLFGGASSTQKVAGAQLSSMVKWEGAALLISSVTSTGRAYSLSDRWTLSRDRNVITVRRQYITNSGLEHESTVIYEREGFERGVEPPPAAMPAPQSPSTPTPAPSGPPAVPSAPQVYRVPVDTRMLLRVTRPVTTKHAQKGDRIYLELVTPVMAENRQVLPPGTQVIGTVSYAKRPGRVKGRAELLLVFDSIILRNGVQRDIRSRPAAAEAQDVDRREGVMRGDTDRGRDAARVGSTAASGAGIGGLAGGATGAGIGAGIGALAGVLGSRGPEIVLPQGSTVEMLLDRTLEFSAAELR